MLAGLCQPDSVFNRKEPWIRDNSLDRPIDAAVCGWYTKHLWSSSISHCIQAAFFLCCRPGGCSSRSFLSCFYTLTESFPPGTEEPWEGSARVLTSYEVGLYFTCPEHTRGRLCQTTLTRLCVSVYSLAFILPQLLTAFFLSNSVKAQSLHGPNEHNESRTIWILSDCDRRLEDFS